jgi:DNA-binding SARP family transcriptional activator/TolB-like protein/Tfp pilus assembly protein PilF
MTEAASTFDQGARPVLNVTLLGPMEVSRTDGGTIELPRKVRALFAYLLMRRGTTVPRQTLLGLLWADRAEAQARSSLRQALNVLRTCLDDVAEAVLISSSESVSVRANAVLTDLDRLDADAFSDVGGNPHADGLELLEGLALGEPAFDDWLAGERERVRARTAEALRVQAHRDEKTGQLDLAAAKLVTLLRFAPTDEEAHRHLMRLHLARSRTDDAIRQFEKCRAILRDQLDVEPEQATVEIWETAKRARQAARRNSVPDLSGETSARPILVSADCAPEATAYIASTLSDRGGIPVGGSGLIYAFQDGSTALRACAEARTNLRDLNGSGSSEVSFALHHGEAVEPGMAFGTPDLRRLARLLEDTPRDEIHVTNRFFKAVRRTSPFFFDALSETEDPEEAPVLRLSRAMQRQPFLAVYENPAPRSRKRPCSLAVAPIRHVGPDSDNDAFWSDGLTEDLILELSRTQRITVSSRTTLCAIQSHDAVEIGQELGVGYVLTGSFRKMGQTARLNFTLAETEKGTIVWSERFSAELDTILEVIDEIVAKVVARISGKIERSETEAARLKRPENMTAYEYYLRGSWHHRMGGITTEHSRKAVEWLRKAIETDPNFSRPRAMLCCAWSDLPDYDEKTADDMISAAYEADPHDPETNRILAYIKFQNGEHEIGVRHAERSVELAPHDAYLLGRCAAIHVFNGDPETGLARLERAVELDPFVPVYIIEERLSAYYLLSDYEKVIEEARALHHQTRRSRYYTAASLVALGRTEEARRVMKTAIEEDPSLSIQYLRCQELYRDPKVLAQLEHRVRKAGMPE